jgi:uncharacterized protein YdeI (YjbR/CyaY-like superfamily)
MEITKTLHVTERREWRRWLRSHYRKEKDVWLVYYKKHTGKPRISYNDAVEEALCFGWIDSTVRSLDEDRSAQRFSPRKPGSAYSQANKERLRALLAQGKVIKEVAEAVAGLLDEEFTIPADILKALKADEQAWKHFQTFPPAYQRIRVAFIEGARDRPEEFKKRLRYFVRMTARNKLYGFGGIEKHFNND